MYTDVAHMIRKQVYIEPRHEALLKRVAKAAGISEAELIRRGIELAADERATAFRKRNTSPLAEQAWQDADAFLDKRKQLHAPQTGRTWTRDELYEERLARVAH